MGHTKKILKKKKKNVKPYLLCTIIISFTFLSFRYLTALRALLRERSSSSSQTQRLGKSSKMTINSDVAENRWKIDYLSYRSYLSNPSNLFYLSYTCLNRPRWPSIRTSEKTGEKLITCLTCLTRLTCLTYFTCLTCLTCLSCLNRPRWPSIWTSQKTGEKSTCLSYLSNPSNLSYKSFWLHVLPILLV